MEETVSKKDGLRRLANEMSAQLSQQRPGLSQPTQHNSSHYIMKSPEYTRAITVGDPKERILSAYLNNLLQEDSTYAVGACCKTKKDCWEEAPTLQASTN
jgi:hypothetical protein